MRAKAWAWLSLLFLLAGCGSDPATSRLAPGSTVAVYRPDAADGGSSGPVDRVLVRELSDGNRLGPSVLVGIRATVASDEQKSNSGRRWVKVNFQDGEYKGLTGLIDRENLRPVK